MRAVVLALADLGRSARMQYHARALAESGVEVDFVGYQGTPLPRAIAEHPRITVHRLTPSSRRFRERSAVGYAIVAVFDTMRLSYRLWRKLRTIARPNLILVQNPPAFPTVAISWFSLKTRDVRFVVDWHNLGYTVLALRLGRWHPVVRLARWYERRDARIADLNLSVSRGMASFIENRFGVSRVHVLYDRPASVFVPLDRMERE